MDRSGSVSPTPHSRAAGFSRRQEHPSGHAFDPEQGESAVALSEGKPADQELDICTSAGKTEPR